MDDYLNNDIEKINEEDVEIIPPPVAPEAPKPDFVAGGSVDDEQETSYGASAGEGYTNDTYAGTANSYATTDDGENVAKILGIVSLVTGILSLLCCCIPILSLLLAVAAVVTGIISIKKGNSVKGLAIAGIVCGSIGVVIGIVLAVMGGLLSNSMDEVVEVMDGLETYL